MPPSPPPSPPPAPAAPVAERPAETETLSDSAVLARILALFEVWNEPPPAWMAEALRDEVVLLSPDAWPTLESLGNQGLDLLVTLQAHDMLPESAAALRAIGEVETVLRAGIAAELGAAADPAAPLPMLTLAASWLCEALENFLSAQADPKILPERLDMAQAMLGQALRGMTEADWTSLDQFPEKASRVRVLTDRLREDLRRPAAIKPGPAPTASPADPIETIIALLKQVGFALEAGLPAPIGPRSWPSAKTSCCCSRPSISGVAIGICPRACSDPGRRMRSACRPRPAASFGNRWRGAGCASPIPGRWPECWCCMAAESTRRTCWPGSSPPIGAAAASALPGWRRVRAPCRRCRKNWPICATARSRNSIANDRRTTRRRHRESPFWKHFG